MATYYKLGGLTGNKPIETDAKDPKVSEVRMTIDEYRALLQRNRELRSQLEAEKRNSDRIEAQKQDWIKKKEAQYQAKVKQNIADAKKAMLADQEGKVWITQEEYNGLQKALRIVRDRACQQVDKAKADEHGYTLQSANLREYDRKKHIEAWLIKKSTPYSIKIPAEEAKAMIIKDLKDFYGYIEFPVLSYQGRGFMGSSDRTEQHWVDDMDILLIAIPRNWLHVTYGDELRDWWESLESHSIIIKIDGLSANYGRGVYEVTYWATNVI